MVFDEDPSELITYAYGLEDYAFDFRVQNEILIDPEKADVSLFLAGKQARVFQSRQLVLNRLFARIQNVN